MLAVATTIKNVALGAAPWVVGGRDYSFEAITAQELTALLSSPESGARIESICVQPASTGTTDRARLSLTWNAAGTDADLPSRLFAKGTASTLSSRIIGSTFGLSDYEARFYTQVYPAVSELTLTPYIARSGRGGRFLIVMEDLSADAGVHFFDAGEQAPLAHVENVIDGLAKLHGTFWNSPRFNTDLKWLTPYTGRPGNVLAQPTLRLATKKFLREHPDLPGTVHRLTQFYIDNRQKFDRVWQALPATLTHGDPHLGNTFSRADGTSGFYDWQVIHKMSGFRDFAYFMGASVPTELRQAHEKDLLSRYLDRLVEAGGEAPSLAEAFDIYRLLTMESWIAVYATAAIGGMQEAEITDRAMARCVTALLDLDTEAALRDAI
jgi:hypothetical protein